ncbi:MAG TPA: 50S ribosomal protein L18Ae [Thermoplasmata archaeon]|nr:50S ribosomal protein L18Ae [Thermoplasmata archaeon]
MPSTWKVTGAFLARRGYWQNFAKLLDAKDAAAARERAVSQIGGSHHVGRSLIRIDSVEGA